MRTHSLRLAAALLLCGAAVRAQVATETTDIATIPGDRWSFDSGETISRGRHAASVEAGWPGVSLGITRGLSETTDVGARLDLLYGIENTTSTQFGLGLRVPYRMMLARSGAMSVLAHVDPGIKLYTSDPATFALQAPIGIEIGYALNRDLRVEAGADLPLTLGVTPSAELVIAPLVGAGIEYRLDRDLTIGLDTRVGPVWVPTTEGAGTSFGFRTLLRAAYRL